MRILFDESYLQASHSCAVGSIWRVLGDQRRACGYGGALGHRGMDKMVDGYIVQYEAGSLLV